MQTYFWKLNVPDLFGCYCTCRLSELSTIQKCFPGHSCMYIYRKLLYFCRKNIFVCKKYPKVIFMETVFANLIIQRIYMYVHLYTIIHPTCKKFPVQLNLHKNYFTPKFFAWNLLHEKTNCGKWGNFCCKENFIDHLQRQKPKLLKYFLQLINGQTS